MPRALSVDQMNAFRRDGFLVIRGLFTPTDVRDQERWIDEIAHRPPEAGRQMVYFEDSLKAPGTRVLARIEKFSEYHAGMGRLVADPRLLGPISDLLGEDAVLFKEKVNFKMPGGAGFTPHQDIQPGWDRYAPYFLSVLIAVDANTIENGCLELAAGHHHRGLIGRKWEPLEGDELAGVEFVAYPMAPGDAAFFDCFTPHQSQPNLTDRPRRNIYLTYNRRSDGDFREQYFADKRKSYPPDFERDPNASYVFRV
ncbi:MAG: phytanoyl-CoA dioxygenase family protein [Acidobacteria bacterium]|nr:phytanoyl-CoA dioxygenase family protein [Acidobacteriota bacterium]